MSESLNHRIRFTKTRQVVDPCRNNDTDAGIDFYVPTDLTIDELMGIPSNKTCRLKSGVNFREDTWGFVEEIILNPGQRILIPSGIQVLIEPEDSMLQANNKSGISSKQGLIFTAEVVDSPYVGEVHIGVVNTGVDPVTIIPGKKLVQFIHIPVYLTKPQHISNSEYNELAKDWGTRGNNGFGSGD